MKILGAYLGAYPSQFNGVMHLNKRLKIYKI